MAKGGFRGGMPGAMNQASMLKQAHFIELFNFSFFRITDWGIDLDYCDIEWFALETNRNQIVSSH